MYFIVELNKLNNKIANIEDPSEEAMLSMKQSLVRDFPGTFLLPDGFLTMNLYRVDISALVSPDGYLKIGNILYKYSYSHIKAIANCEKGCEKTLEDAWESDDSKSIFISEVQRASEDSNLKTSFESTCQSYKSVDCGVLGQRTMFKVRGHLILTTVYEPKYVQGTCIDYDEQGREFVYPCMKPGGSDKVNYFTATIYNETRLRCINSNFQPNSSHKIMMEIEYTRNGTPIPSFDIFSPTTTSQFSYQIFKVKNSPTIDVTNAKVTFTVLDNDPVNNNCIIGFNY